MCDKGNDAGLPSSLQLLDQLRTPGSPLRSQLCVAVSTISRRIAKEQQRALAQVRSLKHLHGRAFADADLGNFKASLIILFGVETMPCRQ